LPYPLADMAGRRDAEKHSPLGERLRPESPLPSHIRLRIWESNRCNFAEAKLRGEQGLGEGDLDSRLLTVGIITGCFDISPRLGQTLISPLRPPFLEHSFLRRPDRPYCEFGLTRKEVTVTFDLRNLLSWKVYSSGGSILESQTPGGCASSIEPHGLPRQANPQGGQLDLLESTKTQLLTISEARTSVSPRPPRAGLARHIPKAHRGGFE
jgi:hypothetical protein